MSKRQTRGRAQDFAEDGAAKTDDDAIIARVAASTAAAVRPSRSSLRQWRLAAAAILIFVLGGAATAGVGLIIERVREKRSVPPIEEPPDSGKTRLILMPESPLSRR
jgi:hypothetical protein